MKRKLITCVIVIALVLLTTSTAFASGSATFSGRCVYRFTSYNYVYVDAPLIPPVQGYVTNYYNYIIRAKEEISSWQQDQYQIKGRTSYEGWPFNVYDGGTSGWQILGSRGGEYHLEINNDQWWGQYTMYTSGQFSVTSI